MKNLLGTMFLCCTLCSFSVNALEVACENVAGKCKVSDNTTECNCNSGIGMGSSSGYDPDGPQPDPKTEAELQAECEAMLVEACGDSVPDVDEHCSADQLALCTSYEETMMKFVENCEPSPDEDSVSTSETSQDPEWDTEGTDGPPSGAFLPPTVDNPWLISQCCDELSENQDMEGELQDVVDCLSKLSAEDCEGAEACFGESGWEGGHTSTSKDEANDAESGSGSYDDQGGSGDGEESADDTDSDDGKCQISASLGHFSFSLFSLIANLF